MTEKRTLGFWILLSLGILILIILFVGQMMAFINYDFTVSIGLQEPVEVMGEMGVAVNKGFGVGDTIIYIPLLTLGLAGLWFRKKWGIPAMASALGITAYWPMVCLCILLFAEGAPGFHFIAYASYTIMLTTITIYGLWGLWYLNKNHRLLVKE